MIGKPIYSFKKITSHISVPTAGCINNYLRSMSRYLTDLQSDQIKESLLPLIKTALSMDEFIFLKQPIYIIKKIGVLIQTLNIVVNGAYC